MVIRRKKKLIALYFQSNPNKRRYRQRLFHSWKDTNIRTNISEQNLSDKCRYLLNKNYFTEQEISEIQANYDPYTAQSVVSSSNFDDSFDVYLETITVAPDNPSYSVKVHPITLNLHKLINIFDHIDEIPSQSNN